MQRVLYHRQVAFFQLPEILSTICNICSVPDLHGGTVQLCCLHRANHQAQCGSFPPHCTDDGSCDGYCGPFVLNLIQRFLISVSSSLLKGYDEPKIISYENTTLCLMVDDGEQSRPGKPILMRPTSSRFGFVKRQPFRRSDQRR